MNPPIRRVLVVVKILPRPESRAHQAPFVRRDLRRLRTARRIHQDSLRRVLAVLRKSGIPFQVVRRSGRRILTGVDLVISVGGDGTFLEAARAVRGQRILGINSHPTRSAGSFCAATAKTFQSVLKKLLQGRARMVGLNRMRIVLNRRPVDLHVLNDVLITHRRPGGMSRYWLKVGRVQEEQRSSGLWIATAAGSTAAIRSAGGRVLPRASRSLQYRLRELYAPGRNRGRLKGGVVPAGMTIRIGSLMKKGLICVDGEHVTLPFRYGDGLEIRPSPYPLRWVSR